MPYRVEASARVTTSPARPPPIPLPSVALSPEARRDRLAVGRVIQERLYRSVYQPIVDLTDRRIEGFECLTRFALSPGRSPDLWFQRAARAGLSHRLEADTIRCALRAFDVLPPGMYLSLNASAEAVRHGGVLAVLDRVDPRRIVLELTEHDPVRDYAGLTHVLGPFRAAGLRLAVDDVGTGYADLQHLVQLRPDMVKLDISLTRRVLDCLPSRAMIDGLVTFTHAIGGRVVAEGIETADQLAAVRTLGVDAGQGFFLGRPIGAGIEPKRVRDRDALR